MKLKDSKMLFYAFSWRYFLKIKLKINCEKGQNAQDIEGITNFKRFFSIVILVSTSLLDEHLESANALCMIVQRARSPETTDKQQTLKAAQN